MNPTDVSRDFCEWPVQSSYFGVESRACGRAASGSHVRLCWQHRDAATAEVIDHLYVQPDAHLSEMLADWVRSTAPVEHDTEERAAERAKSRDFAAATLTALIEHYGDVEPMPPHLQQHLRPVIDRLIEARMRDTWGGAA